MPKKKLTTRSPQNKPIFPIVGIGASAGGLEAIAQILNDVAPDTGMAFVVVQHLDPTHESLTAEILARKTRMPVEEVRDGMRVKPDHVYVIPPNRNLGILNGVLKLLARTETRGQHMTIDFFFQSLASEQKNMAVGVVLSGTAADGTHGLEAIREEGGLTIAQDPKTAKYDSMPRSAIASGTVDLVLAPGQIASELTRIARHPLLVRSTAKTEEPAGEAPGLREQDNLAKIFILLRNQAHVDFSHYKRNTIMRRITRRMVLQKKDNLEDYVRYLQANPAEVQALFADTLINVTEFFRDPDAFTELKEYAFPALLQHRPAGTPFRIWVVGCATGEEVYSVAISLLEFLGDTAREMPIQIFATDISETAIQKARSGLYPESITRNVSQRRLQKYFVKTEGGYKIAKFIRDLCLFSLHDVTNDPPFAKLDLVCCRNLLIYFDATLQRIVLPIFHYALNPGGILWVGRSETIGSLTQLFGPLDGTTKFYIHKDAKAPPQFRFPVKPVVTEKYEHRAKAPGREAGTPDIQRETDRLALAEYAPPGVVIDSDMNIVLARGETAPFLLLPPGQVSLNLFKMARPELSADLRMAIQAAKKTGRPARRKNLNLRDRGRHPPFGINVVPLKTSTQMKEHFLVFFEPPTVDLSETAKPAGKRRKKNVPVSTRSAVEARERRITELERLLAETLAYQQSLAADAETAQQELTSANEELQSTNEELQSANEELETAKEELQSSNEELTTVNDELQNRNSTLTQLSNDLLNLLAIVDIPIVMVGADGRIRRFTANAGKVMNLIQSDVGRPIGDLRPGLDVPNLNDLVTEVIETVTPKEREVQDRSGRWYRLSIRPYKTADNRIDGAVLALVDIDLLKRRLDDSKAALDYALSVANTVPHPLVVLDNQLRSMSANSAFSAKFQISAKMIGQDFHSVLFTDGSAAEELDQALTATLTSNAELNGFEVQREIRGLGVRTLLISARRINWIGLAPLAILVAIDDITDRRRMEEERSALLVRMQGAREEAERANHAKDNFLSTLSHELRTPLTAVLSWAQILQRRLKDPTMLGKGIRTIEESAKAQAQLINDLLDVSRMQSGKLLMEVKVVDPRRVVRSAVESLRPVAEAKPVQIDVVESPQLERAGTLSADPDRLRQIVLNLLTNAIKFSSEKGVIQVRLEPVEHDGKPHISIQVIDHGKGIRKDFLPHLFERFSQADSTSARVYSGLGLGLAIVRDLVTLHGGLVRADSAGENQGATFTVLLPLQSGASSATRPAPTTHGDELPSPAQLTGQRILIVDDEPGSLGALNEMLMSFGATVMLADSATEALKVFETFKPDVLISDIAMPGEDGYSLMKKIRAMGPHGSQIPALALTAYATVEDVKRAREVGFTAHVAKPFDLMELIRAVARLAGR